MTADPREPGVLDRFDFPDSSFVRRATYDPATRTLTVYFQNGGAARHRNVPPGVVEGWRQAGSAGHYYRQVFYGK